MYAQVSAFLNKTIFKDRTLRRTFETQQVAYDTMNFTEAVADKYSKEDASHIEKILQSLNVPIPQSGEFFRGEESIHIICSTYGIVLRVGNPLLVPEHDLIVEPWKKVVMNKAVFEIVPIIPSYSTEFYREDSDEMKDMMSVLNIISKDGVSPGDIYDGFMGHPLVKNFGLLPAHAEPFKGRIPVVRDRGAVSPDSSLTVKAEFMEAAYSGVQKRIYEKFINMLKKAWPDNESLPTNSKEVTNFWKACAQEVGRFEQGDAAVLCFDKNSTENSVQQAAGRFQTRFLV